MKINNIRAWNDEDIGVEYCAPYGTKFFKV